MKFNKDLFIFCLLIFCFLIGFKTVSAQYVDPNPPTSVPTGSGPTSVPPTAGPTLVIITLPPTISPTPPWNCCKTGTSYGTCPGTNNCIVQNASCCNSNSATYCSDNGLCSTAHPQCPSGWSSTCTSASCFSCTVICNGCNNNTVCYRDGCVAPKQLIGWGCPDATYKEDNCTTEGGITCCECVQMNPCDCDPQTIEDTCLGEQFTQPGIPNVCLENTECFGEKVPTATWSSWSICSGCTQSRTCTSVCGATCEGPSTQSCGYSTGTDGSCGSADGGFFASTPTSGLCSSGSFSSVNSVGRSYIWTCYGTSGSCGGSDGSNDSCSATRNRAPVFSTLTISNSSDVTVLSDNLASGRLGNHICQTQFTSDRIVNFTVNASDPDGNSDIDSIQLRLGGTVYDPVSLTDGEAVFAIQYPETDPANTYQVETIITDIYGLTTNWVDTNHDFKVWDCMVPVSGTFYDGSAGSDCSTGLGYGQTIPSGINFSLSYRLGGLSPRDMSVNSPTYVDGGNKLVWGTSYIPLFIDFPGADPTQIRIVDLGTGTSNCSTQLNLTNAYVNPYSNNPSIQADYASVMDQLAWFQVGGGGLISKIGTTDSVPVTCGLGNTCVPAITVNVNTIGSNNNGLVAGRIVSNSGCGGECKYGEPNNWYTSANLIQENYDYNYFYNQYYLNLGQGITIPGSSVTMSDVKAMIGTGNTGVVFINGNLTINENVTLALNKYLMLIVKGNITILETVNRVDGILVSGGVVATGISDNRLVINGSIFSTGSINLSRSYETESLNNTSAAVVVNYRPDLLFNMPGRLVKIISGWKQGL